MSILDETSWNSLAKKAKDVFPGEETERGKSGFFDLLNEAFAYEYLKDQGAKNIRFEDAEGNVETPDIYYEINASPRYCEVKTFNISDCVIKKFQSKRVFDSSIYEKLNDFFLKKFDGVLEKANKQISARSGIGCTYIIMHFDDFTLRYYKNYCQQLMEFLSSKYPNQTVIIRVNISSPIYILHNGIA